MELREASVKETLNFLRVKAMAFDPEKPGVNIVLIPSEKTQQAKITISLVNVSVADAVKYIALVANLDIKRDGETFIVKAADESSRR